MIPVSEPVITEEDKRTVLECLNSGWVSSSGKYIDEFEKKWSDYCSMKHGISVSSGTAALQIAVEMLELSPGDEIIMPAFTIISCAQAVTSCKAVPVLVDSNPANWQMDVSQIEDKISPRTKAIMIVHIYGHPADVDPIRHLADKYNLKVIEDAAEVHGAQYKGKRCGGFGDISIFSFYANKLITTGEGGMILTNDKLLANKARDLRNLCFEKEKRFLHHRIGHNFRLTNLQAALGVAQFERMEDIISRKRQIAFKYTERLMNIPSISLPVEESWAKNVYWVYGLTVNKETGLDAMKFSGILAGKGIETRPFFLGMHEQPVFHKMGLFKNEIYPGSEFLSRQGLYLPSGLSITESQIDKICSAVREALKEAEER